MLGRYMDGSITVGQEKESGEWVGTKCSRIRFLLGLQPYYCVYIYIHQQGRKEASTEQTSMKRRKIPNPQQQLGQIYVLPRRRQPHRGLHAAPWPPPPRPWTPSPTSYPQRPLVPHQGDIDDDPAPSTASSPSSTGDTLSKHEAVVHAM